MQFESHKTASELQQKHKKNELICEVFCSHFAKPANLQFERAAFTR